LSQGLSKDFNEEFLLKKQIKLEVPTHIMVLTAGSWPISSVPTTPSEQSNSSYQEITILNNYVPPKILQDSLQQFEQFYSSKHTGRKLSWLYNQSLVDIQLNYLDRPYIITLNVYQLSLVLQFSNRDQINFAELMKLCSLPLQNFLKSLKGIIDAGLLTAHEETLCETSVVTLNTTFTSKRLHQKVLVPQSIKSQEKEVESSCSTVQQDRKYYMECTIVRIMKSRKVMLHNALVHEAIEQSRKKFIPDMQFIKKNIEALIEKQYIRRTEQNDEYEYIN